MTEPSGYRSDLEVRGLTVRYGSAIAVEDVSLTLPAGRITALVGPNGSGKSSTIRAICGAVNHGGSVEIAGVGEVGRSRRARQEAGIAIVPQGRQLFADMTVEDNLRIVADLHRLPKASVEEGLSLFPVLAERRRSLAGVLSGGQQQMLALARAIITRPRVLLLDEPVDGLAAGTVADLMTSIRGLAEDGVAVLVAEPTLGPIARSVDGGAVLLRGRIRARAASAAELERAYAAELGVSGATHAERVVTDVPDTEPGTSSTSEGARK